MTTAAAAPPGWYPDPGDASGPVRYWDGARWTPWQSRGDVMTEVPLSVEGAAAAWDSIRDHRAPWPGPAAAVALAALVASTALALGALVVGRRLGLDTFAGELTSSAVGLYTGMLASCWAIQRRWGSGAGFRRDFGIEYRARDWLRGLLGSLAARGLAMVAAVLLVLLIRSFEDESYQLTPDDGIGWVGVLVFAFVAVVVAPIVEEIFFRGLVQRSLETVLPAWLAIGVQGIAFGLAHGTVDRGVENLYVVVPIAVGGVVLGHLARRYQRLGPAIAAHGFFNLLPVLLVVVLQAIR